jgi:hypothetical protein
VRRREGAKARTSNAAALVKRRVVSCGKQENNALFIDVSLKINALFQSLRLDEALGRGARN